MPVAAASTGGLVLQQVNYLTLGGIRPAAVQPGATAVDSVLAVFTLPAGTFDGISGRGVRISAFGSFATTANNKTVKIIFNPTAAVVGSTVTGGTTLVSTGVTAASNQAWYVDALVFDQPATAFSQVGLGLPSWFGVAGVLTFAPQLVPQLTAADETKDILIAVTGNAATATTDISLLYFAVTGYPI